MVGEPHSPYRPPCGGWKPLLSGRNTPSHYLKHDETIAAYKNVTLVKDYHYAAGVPASTGIAPYAAPSVNGDCDAVVPNCGVYGGDNQEKICGPLAVTDFVHSGTIGSGDYEQIDSYSSDGNVNLAVCLKKGFKAVSAEAIWSGKYAFGFSDFCFKPVTPTISNCLLDGSTPSIDPNSCEARCGGYTEYQNSPNTVKYLTLSGSLSVSSTLPFCVNPDPDPDPPYCSKGDQRRCQLKIVAKRNYSISWTVQPESGNNLLGDNTFSFEHTDNTDGAPTYSYDSTTGDGSAAYDAWQSWFQLTDVTGADAGYILMSAEPDCNFKFPGTSGFIKFINRAPNDGSKYPADPIAGMNSYAYQHHNDPNNPYWEYNGNSSQYCIDPDTGLINADPGAFTQLVGEGSWVQKKITSTGISITFFSALGADGQISVRIDENTCNIVDIAGTTYTATRTLSTPYQSSQVYQDLLHLLNKWDLSDDAQYPWRTDDNVTGNPHVRRDAVSGSPNPVTGPYDPRAPKIVGGYSGKIIGAPNPAGYGWDGAHNASGHWQRLSRNYVYCYPNYPTGSDRPPAWIIVSYGAKTPYWLPQNATNWVDNYEQTLYPDGAWIISSASTIRAQKWAETLIKRPSYNFARPCGKDRASYDETRVICDDDSKSGYNFTYNAEDGSIYIPDSGCPQAIADGEHWIFPAVAALPAGVYRINGAVAVGDSQISRSIDLIHDLGGPGINNNYISANIIGPQRWPSCPAFCGRIAIVEATSIAALTVVITQSGVPTGSGAILTASVSSGSISAINIVNGGTGYSSNPLSKPTLTINASSGTSFSGNCDVTDGVITHINITNPGNNYPKPELKIKLNTLAPFLTGGPLDPADSNNAGKLAFKASIADIVTLTDDFPIDIHDPLTVDYVLATANVRNNPTEFVINASLLSEYTGGSYVSIHGAPSYEWNDDQSKGDYMYQEWQFNNRDIYIADALCAQCNDDDVPCKGCAGCSSSPLTNCLGPQLGSDLRVVQASHGMPRNVTNFICEDHCLGYTACTPSVISIAPPGQDPGFAGDNLVHKQFTMPYLEIDEFVGSQWNALITQHIPDPLWQPPTSRCRPDCSAWKQDYECCAPDTTSFGDPCSLPLGITYYPHAPMVEARATMPEYAPALPPNIIAFNYYSLPELQELSPTAGKIVAIPPAAIGQYSDGTPRNPETPWGLWWREHACTQLENDNHNGVFKNAYIANGAYR